jgi:hypothetical protein
VGSEAQQLRDAVVDLADRVNVAQQQTRLLRRLTLTVGAFGALGLIIGGVFATLLFLQLHRTNDFLGEATKSRAAIFQIQSCIDPKGVCARRQQQATGKVIGQIVDTNHNGKPDTQEILNALKALRR